MNARHPVNTGAEINVLPANSEARLHEPVFNLQTADGEPTATYGKRYNYLNISSLKVIHWILMLQTFLCQSLV